MLGIALRVMYAVPNLNLIATHKVSTLDQWVIYEEIEAQRS